MHRKQHYLRLVILQFILYLVYRICYRRLFVVIVVSL